ncbi:hypothetical protein FB45DRAFT_941166 [Roridomyces roridus]|uniref:Uncharacterized protein n=1 Tax=Roridomyces roridus TaxID=1738132 RepID=A0AAD7FAA7_9AGAR|nr:hypothetical protein FB45DRAFT_941166 [Roridomyces roridus]
MAGVFSILATIWFLIWLWLSIRAHFFSGRRTPQVQHAERRPSPEPNTESQQPGTPSDAAPSLAARQAHVAAELRAAQGVLKRAGKGQNVERTRARVRELEGLQSDLRG